MKKNIKKFLIKTSVLVLVVVALVAALCVVANLVIGRANFKIQQSKNILILGDSHTECAIDDEIFNRAINMSQGGVGYLYEFAVLRKMVEANPHIDTIILSFHPEVLSQRSNNGLYELERTKFKLPLFINIMSASEIDHLNVPCTEVIAAYVGSIKYAANLMLNNFDYRSLKLGGYLRLERHQLDQGIENFLTMEPDKDAFNRVTLQWQVLDNIATFCHSKGIALILMDAPKHKTERTIHRPLFYEQMKGRLPKGVTYVDYSDFALTDSCYGDVVHVNYIGAEKFSRYLQDSSFCSN